MRKLRLYLDTSVIGGNFDPEFQEPTRQLFEYIRMGVYEAFISDITNLEINGIPVQYRDKFTDLISKMDCRIISESVESLLLAKEYIAKGILSAKNMNDARHVAAATGAQIEYIISWDFKHLVNINNIRAFNLVNLQNGYNTIDIRTPEEVISHV